MPLLSGAVKAVQKAALFAWDICLTLANLVTPNLKPGHVVPHGSPGAGGMWPAYVPPGEGDSRSCCPALNALANHGILPHDGRNIKFTEMTDAVRASFNFASTFCVFVPSVAADMLKRNYKTDTFDLADLNLHNAIEHDASLTRQDAKYDPDQGKPYLPFIDELLASATGKDPVDAAHALLTSADMSRYSSKRRADARATNPEFSLDEFHKIFGSSNSSTLLTIFGGRLADLTPFLREERIREGWEPCARERMGMTILKFNRTALKVEMGIKEEPVRAPAAEPEPAPAVSESDGAAATV